MIKKGTRLKIRLDNIPPSYWDSLQKDRMIFVAVEDCNEDWVYAILEKHFSPIHNKEYYFNNNNFSVPDIIVLCSESHYEILRGPEQLNLFEE